MKLIFYGSKSFEILKFSPVVDHFFKEQIWSPPSKPHGGLWTSPVDSKFGWKDWCEAENFRTEKLIDSFTMDFQGSLLVIDSVNDLEKIPWHEMMGLWFPRFEPLKEKFDAIHLTIRGERATRHTQPKNLYGWDCETVFVMNPASVKI